MGGFGSTAFNISSNAANSPAAATAIANAMANAGNIVNLQYGQAPVTVNGNTNSVNPLCAHVLLVPFVQWIRTERYERSDSGSSPERDTN